MRAQLSPFLRRPHETDLRSFVFRNAANRRSSPVGLLPSKSLGVNRDSSTSPSHGSFRREQVHGGRLTAMLPLLGFLVSIFHYLIFFSILAHPSPTFPSTVLPERPGEFPFCPSSSVGDASLNPLSSALRLFRSVSLVPPAYYAHIGECFLFGFLLSISPTDWPFLLSLQQSSNDHPARPRQQHGSLRSSSSKGNGQCPLFQVPLCLADLASNPQLERGGKLASVSLL